MFPEPCASSKSHPPLSQVLHNPASYYEGGYLRKALKGGGYLNSTGCFFLSTEPFSMFLDVLENRDHARSFKISFIKIY